MARKTKKQAQRELKRIRAKLGQAMRRADGVVAPLRDDLTRGYRWEPDEIQAALTASANLADSARAISIDLQELVETFRAQFSPRELTWIGGPAKRRSRGQRGAIGGLEKAAKFLDDISPGQMQLRAAKWLQGEQIDEAHEIYFLRRFAGAMRLLKMSWTRLFYASQQPSISTVRMTAAESRAYHNVLSPGVRDAVHEQADDKAERGQRYVEVYDSDGELVYVASPVARTAMVRNAAGGDVDAKDMAMFKRLWDMKY